MHKVISPLSLCLFLTFSLTSTSVYGLTQQRPNGAAGDPGQNGGDGTNGAAIDWHATNSGVHSNHRFYSGHGQHGGHGGQGIDGSDPDSIAQGGNGGRGGNGGNIDAKMSVVPKSLWQYYYAGNGGAGGTGGASVGLPNGSGASGGNGGSIILDLSAEEAVDAFGYGGNGGTGYGFGNRGGNGGDVSAEVHMSQANHTDSLTQRVAATLVAGNGANGIARADAGSGGNANLASGSQIESSADQYRFVFNVTGGNGGTSYGANGGAGGQATITAPNITSSSTPATPIPQGITRFLATGGNGGNSHLFYGSAARAGNGGHAVLNTDANSQFDVHATPNFKIDLVGGNGGSVTGSGHLLSGLNSAAGNGGDARLDGFSLNSSNSNPVNRQFIFATGGNGGNNSFGRAGDGGNATLNSMQSDSNLHYAQWTLTGGNGGDGISAGNGGNASMIDALDFSINNVTSQFYLRAAGGYAGSGDSTGGIGGDAVLKQTFQASAELQIEGNAVAGLAANGNAGSATSDLTGIAHGTAKVTVVSSARPEYIGNTPLSRTGSSVLAKARAQSDSGKATSQANASAGRGWEKSGTAESISIAHSLTGTAVAGAGAVSTSSPLAPPSLSTSYSNAKSLAIASGAEAFASSGSIAYGHFTNASSKSSVQGNSGTAATRAETRTTSRFHWAISEMTVDVADNSAPVLSESRLAFRQSYQEDTSNQIRIASFLEGDQSTLAVSELGTLTSQYDFSAGAYDLLSTTEFIINNGNDAFDFSSALDIRQSLDQWNLGNDYYLFFYGMEAIAGGVQDLHIRLFADGDSVLDQTFSNGDLAVDYLNNWSTQIGDADDASIKYDLLFDGQALAQQQFTLKMGVAGLNPTMSGPQAFRAVPEPSSAGLMFAIASGLLLARRRRSA